MPFLSQDWRSPGEKWVKYEGGWEMKKTVLTTHCNGCCCCRRGHGHADRDADQVSSSLPAAEPEAPSSFRCELCHEDDEDVSDASLFRMEEEDRPAQSAEVVEEPTVVEDEKPSSGTRPPPPATRFLQPFCPVTLKSTREVAGFNALADALLRLDFPHAVKDVRRSGYVSKILFSLFSHDRLSQLPGAAQRVLFRTLEEMADAVYSDAGQRDQHVLRKLLDDLHATMSIYRVWGSHLGSSSLFRRHLESRRRITEMVERMQTHYKQDLAVTSSASSGTQTRSQTSDPPSLVRTLPEECVREILLRLSDPKDVERAGDACATMGAIARERRVWRELVQAHFAKQQIEFVLARRPEFREKKDWKELYKALRRKFGLRESFAETLMLCRKCRVLFWQSLGHPCLVAGIAGAAGAGADDKATGAAAMVVPIPPQTFLAFFSV